MASVAVLHPMRAGTEGRAFRRWWGSPQRVLNVGSGKDRRQEWVNMDLYAPDVDVRHDMIRMPWPFDDGTFDGVWCSHVLEHIAPGPPDPLGPILREIQRVLKPGGRCCILVPFPGSPCDLANVTHYRRFHPRSFDWMAPTSTGSVRYMYGVDGLELEFQGVQRGFRLFGLDSRYHGSKYLGRQVNLGPKSGLIFGLRRTDTSQRNSEVTFETPGAEDVRIRRVVDDSEGSAW